MTPIHCQTAAISTLLYLVPKALTYLCTRPLPEVEGIFNQMRENLSHLQEQTKDLIGEKSWFILTDVVADNLWLSFLLLKSLTYKQSKGLFENFDRSLQTTAALVSFCATAWLIRLSIVKAFPSTKRFIATRSYS